MAEQTIEQQISTAQQELLHKASEVRNALESVKNFMQEHEQTEGTIKNAQLAVLMGILRNEEQSIVRESKLWEHQVRTAKENEKLAKDLERRYNNLQTNLNRLNAAVGQVPMPTQHDSKFVPEDSFRTGSSLYGQRFHSQQAQQIFAPPVATQQSYLPQVSQTPVVQRVENEARKEKLQSFASIIKSNNASIFEELKGYAKTLNSAMIADRGNMNTVVDLNMSQQSIEKIQDALASSAWNMLKYANTWLFSRRTKKELITPDSYNDAQSASFNGSSLCQQSSFAASAKVSITNTSSDYLAKRIGDNVGEVFSPVIDIAKAVNNFILGKDKKTEADRKFQLDRQRFGMEYQSKTLRYLRQIRKSTALSETYYSQSLSERITDKITGAYKTIEQGFKKGVVMYKEMVFWLKQVSTALAPTSLQRMFSGILFSDWSPLKVTGLSYIASGLRGYGWFGGSMAKAQGMKEMGMRGGLLEGQAAQLYGGGKYERKFWKKGLAKGSLDYDYDGDPERAYAAKNPKNKIIYRAKKKLSEFFFGKKDEEEKSTSTAIPLREGDGKSIEHEKYQRMTLRFFKKLFKKPLKVEVVDESDKGYYGRYGRKAIAGPKENTIESKTEKMLGGFLKNSLNWIIGGGLGLLASTKYGKFLTKIPGFSKLLAKFGRNASGAATATASLTSSVARSGGLWGKLCGWIGKANSLMGRAATGLWNMVKSSSLATKAMASLAPYTSMFKTTLASVGRSLGSFLQKIPGASAIQSAVKSPLGQSVLRGAAKVGLGALKGVGKLGLKAAPALLKGAGKIIKKGALAIPFAAYDLYQGGKRALKGDFKGAALYGKRAIAGIATTAAAAAAAPISMGVGSAAIIAGGAAYDIYLSNQIAKNDAIRGLFTRADFKLLKKIEKKHGKEARDKVENALLKKRKDEKAQGIKPQPLTQEELDKILSTATLGDKAKIVAGAATGFAKSAFGSAKEKASEAVDQLKDSKVASQGSALLAAAKEKADEAIDQLKDTRAGAQGAALLAVAKDKASSAVNQLKDSKAATQGSALLEAAKKKASETVDQLKDSKAATRGAALLAAAKEKASETAEAAKEKASDKWDKPYSKYGIRGIIDRSGLKKEDWFKGDKWILKQVGKAFNVLNPFAASTAIAGILNPSKDDKKSSIVTETAKATKSLKTVFEKAINLPKKMSKMTWGLSRSFTRLTKHFARSGSSVAKKITEGFNKGIKDFSDGWKDHIKKFFEGFKNILGFAGGVAKGVATAGAKIGRRIAGLFRREKKPTVPAPTATKSPQKQPEKPLDPRVEIARRRADLMRERHRRAKNGVVTPEAVAEAQKAIDERDRNLRSKGINPYSNEQYLSRARERADNARERTSPLAQSLNAARVGITQDAISRNMKYVWGGNSLETGADCSGYNSAMNLESARRANANAGYEMFDMKQMGRIFGDGRRNRATAASILQNMGKETGDMRELHKDGQMRAGDTIGIRDDKRWSHAKGRWNNIGHVVQVVEDPKTGKLMIAESQRGGGKNGVTYTDAEKWKANQLRKGRQLYASNIDSLAKTQEPKNPAASLQPTTPDMSLRERRADKLEGHIAETKQKAAAPTVIPVPTQSQGQESGGMTGTGGSQSPASSYGSTRPDDSMWKFWFSGFALGS